MNTEFKVGDKVVKNYNGKNCTGDIGTVIKITQKRKDIIVDFGDYKETYRSNGYTKSTNAWYTNHIEHLTPEMENHMKENALIRKCERVFEKADITFEQAKKILEILEGDET